MDSLSKNLALHSSLFENVIVVGNFNIEADNNEILNFCDTFYFANLVEEPTCYKNPDKLSYIDLILTNESNSFQNTDVIETDLSDFHS